MTKSHDMGGVFLRWTRNGIFCLGFLLATLAFGQTDAETGIIAGTVTESGLDKPLAEVTVTLRGFTLATTTDALGRFSLRLVPPGDHVLIFSRPGYTRAVVENIRVAPGQTSTANYALKPQYYDMDPFDVIAEPYEEQSVNLLAERQQSVVMQDSLGSEFLSRVGAGDAAEAAAKVTGVSIVGGKFVVIRGLSDRYTGTTLNGGEVPSADPERKAAQLDLFPSSMIQEIVVSKTFTPDQPGGFTGGSLNIVTKSFPEQFEFSISAGASYNTQGSFNDEFLTYPGGSTDWLAMDDGTRQMPALVANTPQVVLNTIPNGARYTAQQAAFLEQINKSFTTSELSPVQGDSLLGHNFGMSIGDSFKVFGRKVGYFAGINYERDYDFYDNGINHRFEWSPAGALLPSLLLDDVKATEEIGWSTVGSLSFQPLDDHVIGVTYVFNQTAEDEGRSQSGPLIPDPAGGPDPDFPQNLTTEAISWTERNMQVLQFTGDHRFPDVLKLHVNWLASFAHTSQDEPDQRFFLYSSVIPTDTSIPPSHNPRVAGSTPSVPSRYFRTTIEDNQNYKLDADVPFGTWASLEGKLKSGLFLSQSQREYRERAFGYRSYLDRYTPFRADGDPDVFLTPDNLSPFPVNATAFSFERFIWDSAQSFNYDGEQTISATYGMIELPVLERVRLIGGARLEKTEFQTETIRAADGFKSLAEIDQVDVLPAISAIWEVVTNMNVRLSYAQTIARPSYREFNGIMTFDFAGGDAFTGNPNLEISQIENYDLRWEWFRRPGEVLAVSFFYKNIDGPIELAQIATGPTTFQPQNSQSAEVYGVELEARTSLDIIDDLLRNFSIGGNVSFIQSQVPRTAVELANRELFNLPGGPDRPLYDQSPYIINADLSYDSPRLGTTVSVVFNITGPRLTAAGITLPDIYEDSAPRLDFLLSQKIGKHWKVKFSAKNLLNPEIKRYLDFDDTQGNPVIFSSYTKGMEFGLSLSYSY